ncbi:hypothetical protein [uncultured Kordia sp.]|uniref:hypothetical protein n=1 Tax=uncultured Kordia sp. TaxID=507699 RepID=UPI0026278445|nr:hypothetical protein [uncultured Kordia sp.]
MSWKIIKENQRKYADTSYYLKAEKECDEGKLVLEILWPDGFMYIISVDLYTKNEKRKFFFQKKIKKQNIYGCFVSYNDRIEKYGHQIMRMTNKEPIRKLKRLDALQKDGVLNYRLAEKYDITFETTLLEKPETNQHFN